MSVLHSRQAPWALLVAFLAAAVCFFVLAAGQDMGLLPGAFSLSNLFPDRSLSGGQVRGAVTRLEQTVERLEREAVGGTGRALEGAGKRLEGLAGQRPPPPVEPPPEPAAGPSSLLSHRFSETSEGFRAIFTTDRPPAEEAVFFMRGPARWVVDLKGEWRNAARRVNELPDSFIGRVVIGTHGTFLRIVFHYADERAEPKGAPRLAKDANGFTVTVPRPH